MRKYVPGSLLLTVVLFVSAEVKPAYSFTHPPSHTRTERCCSSSSFATNRSADDGSQTNARRGARIYRISLLRCAVASDDGGGLSNDIIQAAEQLLAWEVAAERQSRPVLDLSGGGSGIDGSDLTLSDAASAETRPRRKDSDDQAQPKKDGEDAIDWKSGSVWTATRQELIDLEILSDGGNDEVFLSKCPQLARLSTGDIVESTKVLLDTIGLPPPAFAQHPSLLSYPAQLYPGALEFLSNMMMLPQPTISNLCKTNPELLIGGLDGYIQEQSVKNALGSAGSALYGVSRSVANDVGKTMRESKARPKGL